METRSTPRWDMPELSFIDDDATSIYEALCTYLSENHSITVSDASPFALKLKAEAAIMAQIAQGITATARQNYLTYAIGDYLDSQGLLVNCTRTAATAAVCTLQFTLSAELAQAYIIPAGTEVTTADGIIFATDEALEFAIGETVGTVTATCTTTGTSGNDIAAGLLTRAVSTLAYVSDITNLDVTSGGTEEEEDDDYAERIKIALYQFAVCGPEQAYIYIALTVSSDIESVVAYRIANCPGTVFINFTMTGGELPTDTMIEAVYDACSAYDQRPIGSYVLVTPPAVISYSIVLTWYLSEDDVARATQITEAVEEAVETYRLWQQAQIGRDLNPDRLIHNIIEAGAKRCVITSPVFIALDDAELAVCDADNVSITFAGTEAE